MVKYKVFLLFILISCKSGFNKSIQKKSSNCKLFSKEFNVDEKTFKFFEKEIISFINDDNIYDILKIYYSGGNDKKHHLERWFINEKRELKKIDIEGGNKIYSLINYDYSNFLSFFNIIEKDSFIQICPYSSNNDTYTIVIKERGTIKFKYISTSRNYNALNENEVNKISGALKFIAKF